MKALMSLFAGLPALALVVPAIAAAQPADVWKFEASVNLFMADVGGQVTFPATGLGDDPFRRGDESPCRPMHESSA